MRLISGKLYRVKKEGWVFSFLTKEYRRTNIGELFLLIDYFDVKKEINLYFLDFNGALIRFRLFDDSFHLLPTFIDKIF